MTDIEQDFKEVAEKINLKIKEAAKALKEANALAHQAGFTALTLDIEGDNYDLEGEPLTEKALDKLEKFS